MLENDLEQTQAKIRHALCVDIYLGSTLKFTGRYYDRNDINEIERKEVNEPKMWLCRIQFTSSWCFYFTKRTNKCRFVANFEQEKLFDRIITLYLNNISLSLARVFIFLKKKKIKIIFFEISSRILINFDIEYRNLFNQMIYSLIDI